ncbi:MgtC/SapB family protein [Sphingosinithalassobacter sp. LHW66-3]|uniref:MgtC/SapB family protein n=1 Tax=Sphingosinithalassobacter sp. LHW66-3 TaxID=3424718 RepID=UPI003D6C43AF
MAPLPEIADVGTLEIALRLASATGLGVLLGLDREVTGHSAGIRTHGIVALSSATIMLTALLLFAELRTTDAQPDPLRAIQGLAQAIGFIAAGLIFVRAGDVRNLTTAANIWLSAAVGIACGAGQWQVVTIAAVLGLTLLVALRIAKRHISWIEADDE